MCDILLQADASHSFHFQQPLPVVPLAGKDPAQATTQNANFIRFNSSEVEMSLKNSQSFS